MKGTSWSSCSARERSRLRSGDVRCHGHGDLTKITKPTTKTLFVFVLFVIFVRFVNKRSLVITRRAITSRAQTLSPVRQIRRRY
jgi:hypothetical protein